MRPIRLVCAALIPLVVLSVSLGAQVQERGGAARRDLERELRRAADDVLLFALPPADSVTLGPLTVPAGQTSTGTVVTSGGDLDIRGTINGNAVAIDGDIILGAGGRVTGDAVAVRGRVRLEGGVVEGEMRTLSAILGSSAGSAVTASRSRWQETGRALQIAGTVLALGLALGFGLLLFAGEYLDAVARTLETRFARSFVVGLLGQVAVLPGLLLTIVGLAITVIGILLIPFAAVAYVLAVAGMMALGFLAVAEITGTPLVGKPGLPPRRVALRALIFGTILYLGLWVVAAAFTWQPLAGLVLRIFAAVVTWVALTAGFGAVILSRAGRRRPEPAAVPAIEDYRSWQTPTPVGGVVAARRPTPAMIREQK